MPALRIGTCGWSLAQGAYFARFSAIEIQNTFYEPPQLATARRWRQAAPPGFAFAVKVWQLVTHPSTSPTYRRLKTHLDETALRECGYFQLTPAVEMALVRTLEVAEALGAQALLFQTPASFAPEERFIRNLRAFFRAHPPAATRLCVWEPRGPWPEGLVGELCRELGLVHGVDPFAARPATRGTAYFRLHGIGGYRHRFTDAELDRLASEIRQRLESQEDVWCFFNNVTMADDAARLAARL